MLTTKLVQLIEDHRDAIAEAAIGRMHTDPGMPTVGALPGDRLSRWGTELAGVFRLWVEDPGQEALANRYRQFGRDRFREGLPLAELIRACHIWRECSVTHLRNQGFEQTSFDIYIEEEVEHDLASFFEMIVYHMTRGYEEAREEDTTMSVASGSAKGSWRRRH
jgi:hypothetical protein